MKYRNIPDTDLAPSVFCLGALPFGVSVAEETSFALMDRFVAAGGNFIDSALVYGEWLSNGKGLNERTIGNWMRARGNRQSVIVSTKGAHPRLETMAVQRLSNADISSDVEDSLRNLQTDYIDLYWLHRDDPQLPVGPILDTMNRLVGEGKIRYFGCSNWRLERMREAQEYAAAHGIQGFSANQLMWSLAQPNRAALFDPVMVVMDEEIERYHSVNNMAVMAYNSQARGFFAKAQQTPIEELPEEMRKVYDNAENRQRKIRVEQVAQNMALPVSVVSLAYIASKPFPGFPISGCTTMAQLLENLPAGDVTLTPDVVEYLERGS